MISFANNASNSVENILMHEQLRHSGDRHVSMAVPRWRFTLLLSRNEDEVRQTSISASHCQMIPTALVN